MPKKTMLRLDGSTLWLGGDSRQLTDEDRVVLGELRDRANAWSRCRGDAWLAEIGRELHSWLGTWAARLQAPYLTLEVVAADAVVREAPWELLHDGCGFLVDGGFEVVRRLKPAAPLPAAPPQHGLALVFMAASPRSSRSGSGGRLSARSALVMGSRAPRESSSLRPDIGLVLLVGQMIASPPEVSL